MAAIHLAALIVAAVAAFVMSAAWYIVFATQRRALSEAAVGRASERDDPPAVRFSGADDVRARA